MATKPRQYWMGPNLVGVMVVDVDDDDDDDDDFDADTIDDKAKKMLDHG